MSRPTGVKLVVATLLVLALRAAAGDAFTVRGVLRYDYGDGSGALVSAVKTFTASVDGCTALIRTANPQTGSYVETAFDTDAVYRITCIRHGTNGLSEEVNVGTIDSAGTVNDDGSNINYLWLALASRCCLARAQGGGRLRPIWVQDDPRLETNGFTEKARWKVMRRPPHLPRCIVYLSDGSAHLERPDGSFETRPLPRPYNGGFTNALYTVSATTNVGGLTLPLEFRFVRYGFDGNGIRSITVTSAQITAARRSPALVRSRPRFSGVADVFDHRFANSEPAVPVLHYRTADGQWRTKASLGSNYIQELKIIRLRRPIRRHILTTPGQFQWD